MKKETTESKCMYYYRSKGGTYRPFRYLANPTVSCLCVANGIVMRPSFSYCSIRFLNSRLLSSSSARFSSIFSSMSLPAFSCFQFCGICIFSSIRYFFYTVIYCVVCKFPTGKNYGNDSGKEYGGNDSGGEKKLKRQKPSIFITAKNKNTEAKPRGKIMAMTAAEKRS